VKSLGSISVGFAEAGRLINGVELPKGDAWFAVVPEFAWGTQETVDALMLVARAVREKLPSSPPLRVNHIGKKEGGYLRPHHSHQSGRDVDIGFYYREGCDPGALKVPREKAMDLAANWAFVKAIATQTDTQVVLLDYRVQKVLFDYALGLGEDRAWLDSLFHAGANSLFQHARRHRDHFHVRFFSARSQELGWRIQPLLAKRSGEHGEADSAGERAQGHPAAPRAHAQRSAPRAVYPVPAAAAGGVAAAAPASAGARRRLARRRERVGRVQDELR
jgi:murein endopeptidase